MWYKGRKTIIKKFIAKYKKELESNSDTSIMNEFLQVLGFENKEEYFNGKHIKYYIRDFKPTKQFKNKVGGISMTIRANNVFLRNTLEWRIGYKAWDNNSMYYSYYNRELQLRNLGEFINYLNEIWLTIISDVNQTEVVYSKKYKCKIMKKYLHE